MQSSDSDPESGGGVSDARCAPLTIGAYCGFGMFGLKAQFDQCCPHVSP